MKKNFIKSPRTTAFISAVVFFSLFVTSGFSQHLTISTGGQTGTSGTNWSITGNTLNVGTSGSADINVSVITNHLANVGNLTVILPWQSGTPRNMNINASISYTGSSDRTLTLNSANDMVFANATGITSSSARLNLVLRTALNQATPDHGYIQLNGVTIQTNGGHFWAGGGFTAATWNGLTVGNSLARTWDDERPGLSVIGSSITTNGGNLYLAGLSHDTSDDNGVNWGVNIERSTISSAAGFIEIIGEVKGRFTNGFGLRINGNSGAISIGTTSGAISLNGYGYDTGTLTGNSWRHGIEISDNVAIRTVSGNISLRGEANFASTVNDKEGIIFTTGTSVCSQTGNITLRGSNTRESDGQYSNAIRFHVGEQSNAIRIGFDGTNAYTGNILIEGNSIYQRNNTAVAGSIAIQTTGNLTIQPTGNAFTFMRAGDAGTLTFDDDWNFGTTLGSFTYGKTTNTANLTLSRPVTTAGAMSIYAGNILAQQNLTTTNANANILLQASGLIDIAASRVLQTNRGNITFRSNSLGTAVVLPNGTTGSITLNTGSSLLSNGGNITLGGNFTGTEGAGLYAASNRVGGSPGILINNATLTAAGGNINIYGKCNSSYDDGVRLQANITTTGTGTIGIYGEAFGGFNGTQFFGGITFNNEMSNIETDQGNITLSGKLTSTQSNNTYGINFYRQGGSTGQTKHIQILSKTGAIQITGDNGTTGGQGIGHSSWGNIYFGSPSNNSWLATGDIVFTYFNLVGAGLNGFKVKTKGNVTYQPVRTSFYNAQTFPHNANYTVADSASSLTIGKTGNNAGITIGGNISVAGPITISGGNVTVQQNLTTTATNANILLQATGYIETGDSITATTASNITLNANGGFYSEGTLNNSNRKAITSAGGNITINADMDANGSGVLNLDYLTINSGAGNTIIRGESFNWFTNDDNHRPWINGTGSFTLESNDASFNANLHTIWFKIANGMSGLTLGKLTNDFAIVHDHIGGLSVAGPVTFQGVHVEINENLTSTASGAKMLFKARGYVWVNVDGKTVQSNNGDITFWADADNSQGSSQPHVDYIGLRAGVTVNTLGGKLIMAGGLDNGANGGIASDGIPDNYAYHGAGTGSGGINLGPAAGTGTVVKLLSSGGDIIIRGRTANTTAIFSGIVSQANVLIDAGAGRINMEGVSSVSHGIEFTWGATPNIAITSSYAGVGPAIRIAGGSSHADGIRLISAVNAGNVLIQSTATTGGGILMEGSHTAVSNVALRLAFDNYNPNIQLLSGNGDITLRVAPVGFVTQGLGKVLMHGNIYLGSRLNATTVQGIIPSVLTTNANILLSGNGVDFDGLKTTKAGTTGSFKIEPRTADNSFSAATTIQNLDISTVSTFTSGKVGNTAALTIGSALTAAAPMTFHGAAMAIGGALTATNNDINLFATGAVTQTQPIVASNLGLHGTGTFTLNNTSNNVAALAGGESSTRLGSLSFTDASGGLTIGTVGTKSGIHSSGTVLVETLAGDLSIAQNISSTNTSANAITFNAGKTAGIGTRTGGDIKLSGSPTPTLTMGTNGIAKLFSGFELNSTGLTTLVGGESNVRVNADETTTIFTPVLATNKAHAIYRTAMGTGDLTIVSSGGDAENSTWVYDNGIFTTISSPVKINASVIQGKLALNDVAIEANKVTFSASIINPTANNFKVLSKTHIVNTIATTISSIGGDVLLASNVDDANDFESTNNGYIQFRGGLTINTQGGDITLGGGNNQGSDYALGSSAEDYTEGIRIDQVANFNSGGGNIVMKGKSYGRSVRNEWGASGLGFYYLSSADTISSGTGTILLDGYSQTTTSGHAAGVLFHVNNASHPFTIQSANTTANAITINGYNHGTAGGDTWGIETELNTSLNITATGVGGGVTINAGNNTNDFFYDIVWRGPTNILANGGPISLNGKYNNGKGGGRFFLENNLYLGSKAGSVVPSSSSNITIQFDSYSFGGYHPFIATTGAVDWKSASASFRGDGVQTDWFTWNQNGQTMRSFTLGKTGNAANLLIDKAITAAGPINMYGGAITINAALTSSDTGNIFLKSIRTGGTSIINNSTITKSGGTGVLTMQGNASVTNGGTITASGTAKLDVVLWSDFDNTNNDGGTGFDGTISTNGGHVWMGGSNTNGGSYTWNGLTVGNGPSIGSSGYNGYAMDFFGNITTNGGDVLAWAGNGSSNGIITNNDGSTVNTGTGDLIFIADQVWGSADASIVHIGTGKVYLLPDGGSYGTTLAWEHNNNLAELNIGGIYHYLYIRNSTSLTGLTFGYYDQMSDSQGPVILTNTSPVTISSPNTIAGPISIYGGAIALNANFATSNITTGNILIKGTSLTGTGNLTLANTRNVNIDVAATSTYDGVISGTQASFTKAGAGLLTLQKDHTYTGATLITRGNLQVGSGGSVSQASSGTINSTSSVTIDSSAKLILAPNEDITFSRPVSGVGGLEIKGASGAYYNVFLTSTAATMATNATVLEILTRITGGLQAGAQIGSGSGEQTAGAYIKSYNALTNTATLQFQQFDGTFTKCVFAVLSQSGTNVQIRGNTSIYNGAAYRNGNHLGVDMSTGSITIGALATSKTGSGYGISNVYMSGKVNFTGALTYQDTTILSNTVASSTSPNTYSFTSKGTQEITDTSSSFPGAVVNNGLVIFKRATPLTIAGNMSGSEEILQVGAPITLLGNNTHSGIITIAKDSSLLIGNGGTSGSIAGNVVNYGRLTFNRSDSSNYRGVISGSGTLIKSGQSPLLMTGANTYTGPTVINAGNLIFERNIPATASSSFSGAGLLEIRPASASFTNPVSYPISGFNISTFIGGLTLGKPGNTANISLTAPVQTAGPVSFYGGDLAINHNIRTNSLGADVLLKATGKINLGASDTIFTNAGDVSLWADADGNSTGYVQLQANSAIVTDGGDINLGGGADLTNGFAIGTANENCPETTGTQYISGVHLRSGTGLNSNGGNINIRGKNTGTANAAMSFGVGFRGSVIHSGTGKIAITGVASGSGNANAQAVSNWGQITLRSASTASDAISIIGDALNVNNAETAMGMNLHAIIEATGTGGGITLNGASGTATGTKISTSFYGDLLAASGPITIIGSNPTGIQDNVSFSGTTVIGKKTGTNVTSSSSNVTIEGNVMATPGAVTIDCIGSLTVRPNSSFTSAFTWPMTNVTVPGAITGLTLGKAGNTANITVAANQTIAGPVSIYGGKININAALTATNSNLNLHARDSVNQTAPITGSGLGLHGTGHFLLSHASNNVSTIAGGDNTTRLGSLHYVDLSGGLEIGSVNPTGIYAAGPVLIETTAGNIELKQPVSSNSNVDSLTGYKGAIVLNAGKSINISTDTGGDIVVSGSGSVSAPNGIVKLFAGNSDGSTGLNSLVGGASNVRTFVDETSTTYSPVLISKEKYAMYRDRSRCFADTASSTPTICVSGILPIITIATTGSTGIGTPSGLPAGVTAAWAFNTITIQGTPSETGVFNYNIPLTGDCGTGNPMAIGTITVELLNTVSVASSTPTLCINTALTDITHTTTGATGIGLPTGLPAGITANWASNVITLSGTPTAAGTFNYIIPLTGGCGDVNALGTITVTPNNTVSAGSTSNVCLSSALTNITHTTTGATGIGSMLQLPLGVSATWASNTITISGTPTETGIFNYSILLTGGCGNVTATGTINVNSGNTVTAASSTPTLCMNTALTDITHKTTGATGIGAPNGLPVGVTARWAADSILLSGTPSEFGTFNYTIPLTGGCGDVSATGTITVTPANTVSAGSSSTVCLSSAITNITHTTTEATGIGTATGLPGGVTAVWASNTITISGTPTATGIFTYNIPLTGGCGSVSAGGTITVNAAPTAAIAVTDQSGLTNNDGTICVGMDAILTATGGSTFTWGDNTTNSILKVSPTVTTSYAVTVVDNNGCSATANTTVTVNSLPVPTVTSTRPNCPTSTTGTALASAGSGWSYLWSSGATTAGITGLTQGLYVVTVTDVNGCMGTASASLVDSTTPLTIVAIKTDVVCYGAQTGAISLAVTGGTSPYSYAWSANASGATSADLTNLPKGNYTVTVTESSSSNCKAVSTIEIAEPSFGIQLNVLVNESSGALANDGTICASESATIKVNVLLSSGASSYLWSVSGNTDDSLVVSTAGAYSVTVTDNIGCVASATSSAITVTPANTVDAASSLETVCINTLLTNITHTTTGATGIGTATDLPAGVTAVWASNTITISGTPTITGIYNYNIPLTGGCGNAAATGTITVTEITSVSLASTSPSLCNNTLLTDIIHTTTGTTGIGIPVNLPDGVTASWSNNTLTISGTPTASGQFNYTIPILGGCGSVNATGTINVSQEMSVSGGSSATTLCINTPLTGLSHMTSGGSTGIGIPTGLPAGVTASWEFSTISIVGTPTESGTFTYSIPLSGGCGAVSATGTIIVTPANTASAASSSPTLCINTSLTNITITTTGATGIRSFTGLPEGVSADWNANVITISGTPRTSGVFNYSVSLSGGCGDVNASGTMSVTPENTASAPSSTPTLCINTPLTDIIHTTTTATGIGTATGLPNGVTAQWVSNRLIILGTPTNSGIFNYSVPLTGGCGIVNATGTITVTPRNTVSAASSTPTLCVFTSLTTIKHSTVGATGIDTAIGLPEGLTANWSADTIYITGIPAISGIFRYEITLAGGCGILNATGTITVIPSNTVTIASSSPTLCVNTTLTNITHRTRGATGIGTATGLPDGVTAAWAADVITISGKPLVSGVYVYLIPLTGGCDTLSAIGVIRVTPMNSAGVASSTPTLCINTVLTNITHATTGATGIGTMTGLPAGVLASWASDRITLSGTPTVTGVFNYSILLTGGCDSVTATGTITVNPDNTVGVASSTPTLCINTALTNITHATTGATGIGTATGLPAGVTAAWSANVITISGTPSASGTFNYSIPLTGGCNSLNATGTIVVTPANTVGVASSTPTLCINSALTNITHATTGATGIGTAMGLPAGVSAAWSANVITISGTPTGSGTFTYSIPLTGACGTINATGTIIVTPANTVSAASSAPELCINSALTNITHTTTGATGIGTATGLPAGVTAAWSANVITISGTPTTSGTFGYSIPLTGGCGTINATGIILIKAAPNASVSVADLSGLVDDDGTICAGDEVILTATGGATFVWGGGQTNSIISVSPSTTTEYTVTVLDGDGCSAVIKTTVVVNTLPVPMVSISSPDCQADVKGSALASAGSGWSYLWSNGSVTPGITGLTQGQYVVTVTDNKGCEGSAIATLVDASVPITVTVSKTDVVCPGTSTGAISLNTSGGSTPYSYAWSSNVRGLTTSSLTNLAAGTYSVTVTEAGLNRCKTVSSIDILEPSFGIQANIVLNENSGVQANDGIICQGDEVTLSVNTLTNEGSSIASYLWSDATGSKTKDINVGLAGVYTVTVTDSKGCSTSVNTTVSVTAVNTVSVASATPTLCINAPLTAITHRTSGATGIGSAVGLPAGVTATWASNNLSINGTPTVTGVFNYTIPLLGGCDSLNATGTITVSPVNTVESASAINSVCVNTVLGNTSFNTTGATGIGVSTGLPDGLTAVWSSNVLKIIGIPTQIGTFNYSIPLTGGCGDVTARGVISVVLGNTVSAASSSPSICINARLTNILHTTGGATGIGVAAGLPAGITAVWAANVITLSGTPTQSGIYTYNIPLTGGCGMVSAMGTIVVKELPVGSMMVTETSGLTNDDGTMCSGSTAILTAKGGSSYTWGSGEINSFLSVSPTATTEYSVTVTANDGCSVVVKKSVTVDASPMPTVSVINPDCVRQRTGTATASTNASWSYLWSNGAATSAITGLAQGSYMVTVTDEKGCKGTAVATLTDPGFPITLNLTKTDVACKGSSTGAITVNVTGGSSPYVYTWSSNAGGSTSARLENLPKGNYSVTVTENGANKCAAVGTIDITEPSFSIQASVVVIENSGSRADDGIICQDEVATLFASALTSPDATISSYQWSVLGGVGQSISVGTAGVYAVTVTDSKGCTTTATSSAISLTPKNAVSAASSTPTTCVQKAITNITHTTTGATGIGAVSGLPSGVSAVWSANVITISGTPTVSGIFTYSIPLTGGCGITNASGTIRVNPDNTVSAASSTPTLCINAVLTNITHATTGATGIGTATGLPAGVSAAWSANVITISGTPTASGTFSYSIPLTGGCDTVKATGTIVVNPAITVSAASSTPTLCINSSLTEIRHTVTNAVGIGISTGLPEGVVASWIPGSIIISGTPLVSGTFNYVISIIGSCANINATGTMIVTPANTVGVASATPTLCINSALTNITHATTGATVIGTAMGLPAGVSARWASNVITISGTPTVSGTFNYTIPLTGGCGSLSARGTITVTSANDAFVVITDKSGLVNNDGTICAGDEVVLIAKGGSTFSWNGGVTSSILTVSPTTTTDYTVSVSSDNGCTAMVKTTVVVNTLPVPTVTLTNPNCSSNQNGSALASTGSGWSYLWSNGLSTAGISGLSQGQYNVTVTDDKGCKGTAMATLTDVSLPITIGITKTDVICQGGSNGTIRLNVVGGSSPYTYAWSSNARGATSANLSNLSRGSYSVTVTEGSANSCKVVSSIEIFEPSFGVQTNMVIRENSGAQANDGIICPFDVATITVSAAATSGATISSYSWNNGSGSSSNSINVSAAGLYIVTVTDSRGCQTTASNTLTLAPDNLVGVASSTPTLCIDGLLEDITHTTTGATSIGKASGLPVGVTATWSANRITISGSPSESGTFNYMIPLIGGCGAVSATGSITVKATKDISIAVTDKSGLINNDGTICEGESVVLNATGAASYVWSGGETKSILIVSPALSSEYSVTATDSDGCISVAKTIVLVNAKPKPTVSTTNTDCLVNQTGSATVSTGNGWSYLWSNGSVSPTISGLIQGQYKVTVTDEKGCTEVATATLTDRSVPITIGVSKTDVVCQGASDGTISLNVSNGTSPYTFVWSSNVGGAASASLTNLPKGNYQVTVTESSANSCKAVRSIEIMEPSFGIQTNIMVSENNGSLSNEGILCPANEVTLKVNAETNAGASISSYLWSNAQGSTSSSITAGAAGVYTVTVTDSRGCKTTASTTLAVTSGNTVSIASSTPALCVNTVLTNITHTTSGATGIGLATGLPSGVTANWSANVLTISGTPRESGTFNYSIPLTGGCGLVNATGSMTVGVNNTVSAPSATPTLCINTALVTITHNTTGATGIGVATGLPQGINASWSANTISLSGSPAVSGTFNYTIPLTGGCGTAIATGTITVSPVSSVTPASSSPTLNINRLLTNITHTTTGISGIGAATGLPDGVSAVWSANVVTISGVPTLSGIFNYSIALTGGCGILNATGTITVNKNDQVDSLLCGTYLIDNMEIYKGEPYSGVIILSYKGGNGGDFTGMNLSSTGVTGLNLTLQPGKLAVGNGSLEWVATGVPADTGKAVFNIAFGAKTCIVELPVTLLLPKLSLDCNSSQLTPDDLGKDVEYTGVLKINYQGGNNGKVGPLTLSSTGVAGLTLTGDSLRLNPMGGTLSYKVTGTPTTTGVAGFTITVGDKTCQTQFNVIDSEVKLSSFFTPNGDGNNDRWENPALVFYPESKVYIFDRTGRLLVEYPGASLGWDGMIGQIPASAGDYWYVIQVTKDDIRRGNFTLIK